MSAQEQIAYLAEKVMGWEYRETTSARPSWYDAESGNWVIAVTAWNPLTDWNHYRQVEEKVMGTGLWHEYVWNLYRDDGGRTLIEGRDIWRGIKADLPTRCKALIEAHKSLHV